MPLLSCTAKSCIYNSDEYCSKGDILVSGEDAKQPDETCCSSFRERTGESVSNSEGCGCKTISVDCEACQCVFNDDERCSADKITINGASACHCDDTRCGSFENK
jgi:hypothetical protein